MTKRIVAYNINDKSNKTLREVVEINREWLITARGEMTHEEVASLAGIKRQYYSMIENGTRNPSVAIAKKIASVLNLNWTIFFEDEGNETLLMKSKSNSA